LLQEKRLHPRRPIRLAIIVNGPSGEKLELTSQDMSMGGMFIGSMDMLPFGAQITVDVDLPGLGPTTLPGVVRWTKKGEGFGIQFGLLGARQTHALGVLVAAAEAGGLLLRRPRGRRGLDLEEVTPEEQPVLILHLDPHDRRAAHGLGRDDRPEQCGRLLFP
jgi:hypothetical protein